MNTKVLILIIFLLGNFHFVQAQNSKDITSSIKAVKEKHNTSYLEVTPEMFKMLSEIKGIDPQLKDYYTKLSSLQMLQAKGGDNDINLHDAFLSNYNMKGYLRLMTSEEPSSKLSFYKKEEKNMDNEFILLSNNAIIYITGTIDLKTIHEFEQILGIAGSAFDM